MLKKLWLQYVRYYTVRAYSSGDWRRLPIQDNGEPLVKVPSEMCHSYYAQEMHLVTDKRIFLRQSVLEQYKTARRTLNAEGYDLIVYDGWRSVELQESLFWHYMREFTAERFHRKAEFAICANLVQVREHFLSLSHDVQTLLRDANRTYVSWPSKDPRMPSPHATGGAIDVWLYQDGSPASLGIPFDWMEEDAGAFYHLKFRRNRFAADGRVCRNRERLLRAMIAAGFSCYPPEIWHFNSGNQMDMLVTGRLARYSYIEP